MTRGTAAFRSLLLQTTPDLPAFRTMTLLDLFPDDDYRFQMRFERAPAAEFFRPTAQHEALITQRRQWLETDPNKYTALLPEGMPLLEETLEFARNETTLPPAPNLQPATFNLQPLLT